MIEKDRSVSLYRRWRPTRFSEVVGQDEVVRTLRNAATGGDVAHAYLFAGERGIGKTTLARILSRAVNCLEPQDGEPCNQCANCTTILGLRSLDIVEIDGASNRGIDHIRRLREEVNYAPTDLRRKVYIIDEVHMLTNEAFNALLKTLEEPPPHAMFVFATTEPHKVPRTIVSRCQAFEFRRITPERIAARLSEVAAAEGASVDPDALELISHRANGGMRDALVMLEQAMSYGGDRITADAVLDMLGLVEAKVQEAFLTALSEGDRTEVMETIDRLVDRGKDLEIFLADIVGLLRRRIVDGRGGAHEIDIAKRLLKIKADLFRSLDRRILLEIGLLDLMGVPPAEAPSQAVRPKATPAAADAAPAKPPEAPIEAVAESDKEARPVEAPDEEPADPEPIRTPAPANRADTAPIVPAPTSFDATWDSMLREIEKDRIAIAAFLTEGRPSLAGDALSISFHPDHSFHKESLEKRDNLQYLAGVVRRHFGDSIHVDVGIDDDVERKPLPHEALQEKARMVCRAFDGKIVKEDL